MTDPGCDGPFERTAPPPGPSPGLPSPRRLASLTPAQQLRAGRRPRRLAQLAVGLMLYGVSIGMTVRAQLGLEPWDVLHVGLSHLVPLSVGQLIILVGVAVLVLWIPLRQGPGLGTIANAVVIGLVTDLTLHLVAAPAARWLRVGLLLGGVTLNGLATALYIGAQFGPGPRDGLMTGLAARTGWPIGAVRAGIELAVLAIGWRLGGVVGVGTVVYAVAIGPLVHLLLPPAIVELDGPHPEPRRRPADTGASGGGAAGRCCRAPSAPGTSGGTGGPGAPWADVVSGGG